MQRCQHLLVQKRDKLSCGKCCSCGVGCYQCSAVSICLCRSVTKYRVMSAAAVPCGACLCNGFQCRSVFVSVQVCVSLSQCRCACLCLSAGVCVFVSVQVCAFVSVQVCVSLSQCRCVCLCLSVGVCVFVSVQVCVFVPVQVCAFVSVQVCVSLSQCRCACFCLSTDVRVFVQLYTAATALVTVAQYWPNKCKGYLRRLLTVLHLWGYCLIYGGWYRWTLHYQ